MTRRAPSPGPDGSEDREWVRQARRGDREAFGRLVRRHQGRAYAVALRIVRSEEMAKDAVQEAFVKAWSSLGRFRGDARFSTWLHRLVVNQSIDLLRREHPERRADLPDEALEERAGETPVTLGVEFGPAAAAMGGELRERLARVIGELPDALRQTLVLREVDGLSYAEIARAQGVPRGTVMSRLHYARRKAREGLIAADVTPTDAEPARAEREESE